MNVLVDTCIWSLALRRSAPKGVPEVTELRELIQEQRVLIVGVIRQELLSGIREESLFINLRDHLRAFPDVRQVSEDFECAAEFFNRCRKNGVQGSNADFLICAVASRMNVPIFTTDADYISYSRFLPITLHSAR
ncbi:MAG TPA: PIN domain-containing protein [Desulfuromonadales bacterium]|nr:PIN domain-containing protein [Desulfuromonadales bacterium]